MCVCPFQIHDADTSEDQSGSSNYKTLPGWKPLERCAALCNRAEFKPGMSGTPVLKREVNGKNSGATRKVLPKKVLMRQVLN